MSTPALQHTIQIRPSHFAGLLFGVAAFTAATTWFASNVDDAHGSAIARPVVSASSSTVPQAYVAGVVSLTGEERAAIYGNLSSTEQHVKDIVSLPPDVRAAVYGNLPTPAGAP